MSFPPLKIIVVGGGAAGFFGALVAAPHNHVNILEAGQQPLAKVRISGGVDAVMSPTLVLTQQY